MVLYAKPSGLLIKQIASDLFTVALALGAYLLSQLVYKGVLVFCDPLKAMSSALTGLQDKVSDTAAQAGKIPAVGSNLRSPLDDIAGQISSLTVQLADQSVMIQRAAVVIGLAVFIIPVVFWLVRWLPVRVRFVQEATAAKELLKAGVGLDLFALRALSHLPLQDIARMGSDPVAAWRKGDPVVIGRLAQHELSRLGVKVPKSWSKPN